jgi:uncharacterized protein YqgV (UPF0045/DUF77 family)
MEADEVIGATVAVYPLYAESDIAVRRAIDSIASTGVDAQVGPMNTLVTGSVDDVFRALRLAFEAAASVDHVVMQATVSNACPLPRETIPHGRQGEATPHMDSPTRPSALPDLEKRPPQAQPE